MRNYRLSKLFDPPLEQWGYRADPILLKRMAHDFAAKPLPSDEHTFEQMIIEKFEEITGKALHTTDLNDTDFIKVPEFARGGMSCSAVSSRAGSASCSP